MDAKQVPDEDYLSGKYFLHNVKSSQREPLKKGLRITYCNSCYFLFCMAFRKVGHGASK